jgi:hypothetical protein
MFGIQRHPISWYTCMGIYVHKSTTVVTTVQRCCLGGPFGVATASAISNAVTYKVVDILRVENYKLHYFAITFFALITPSACSKPTLGALQSTCTVYHCTTLVHLFVCPSSVCCCSAVLKNYPLVLYSRSRTSYCTNHRYIHPYYKNAMCLQ